jgi:hypothetical protein
MIARELTDAVLSDVRWTGAHNALSVVEAPDFLRRQARTETVAKCLLRKVVQDRRRKRDAPDNLVRIGAAFSSARVGSDRGRGGQRADGHGLPHHVEGLDETFGRRTGGLVGHTQLVHAAVYGVLAASSGTQPALGDQHSSSCQET